MTKQEKQVKKQANKIAAEYSKGYIPMERIQHLYEQLKDIGVTVGLLSGDAKTCEWYINGVEVSDSLYCYSMYKMPNSNLVEFNIYFS